MGVFKRWVRGCLPAYRSGKVPDKRDVLGPLMTGLLVGHWRYVHIAALRGDAAAALDLGMANVAVETRCNGRSSRSTGPAVHPECDRVRTRWCE